MFQQLRISLSSIHGLALNTEEERREHTSNAKKKETKRVGGLNDCLVLKNTEN